MTQLFHVYLTEHQSDLLEKKLNDINRQLGARGGTLLTLHDLVMALVLKSPVMDSGLPENPGRWSEFMVGHFRETKAETTTEVHRRTSSSYPGTSESGNKLLELNRPASTLEMAKIMKKPYRQVWRQLTRDPRVIKLNSSEWAPK